MTNTSFRADSCQCSACIYKWGGCPDYKIIQSFQAIYFKEGNPRLRDGVAVRFQVEECPYRRVRERK